ncbi:MAG: FAD-dependent oxidoreductase [Burkholderiales bacterium]|nr:FAD-dependent oxidoreductase [Burkholderiales bacterium]
MSPVGRGPTRRSVLAAGSAAALSMLSGCERRTEGYEGGWVGASAERGHLLRGAATGAASAASAPASSRRVGAIVVGAGIAGLAAARALMRAGVDDVRVLELEDAAGGNSRGHALGGMRCPLGAHYLPTPGASAVEVIELLEQLGVRKTVHGRAEYDERMLCHSPQERLFIEGAWREGLLPPVEALVAGERAATLAAYRSFSAAVTELGRAEAFEIPTARSRWSPALAALDATTFAAWLDARGLQAPALRWYLDYCCRDDYGAGAGQVSAWAGLHYFASRHGFHAPGSDDGQPADGGDGVLTWPEGNAWLAERLAAPLGERLLAGRVVLRVREGRGEVDVDAWNVATRALERWTAARVVVATPLFVAARLLESPPSALRTAAAAMRHAPWLVANLQLAEALDDRPGAPPSWDNVPYGSPGLGYVDAMHQSTRPFAGPTVLTAYWALGGNSAAELEAGRARLLHEDWRLWAGRIVADLSVMHPDLAGKLRRADLMRYGHAMSIPLPGARSSAALAALAAPQPRVQFAHADLSSYSVFEEAFFHGTRAGRAAAAA